VRIKQTSTRSVWAKVPCPVLLNHPIFPVCYLPGLEAGWHCCQSRQCPSKPVCVNWHSHRGQSRHVLCPV